MFLICTDTAGSTAPPVSRAVPETLPVARAKSKGDAHPKIANSSATAIRDIEEREAEDRRNPEAEMRGLCGVEWVITRPFDIHESIAGRPYLMMCDLLVEFVPMRVNSQAVWIGSSKKQGETVQSIVVEKGPFGRIPAVNCIKCESQLRTIGSDGSLAGVTGG
jgi:hypothetical protein